MPASCSACSSGSTAPTSSRARAPASPSSRGSRSATVAGCGPNRKWTRVRPFPSPSAGPTSGMLPDEVDLLLVQDNALEVELTLRPLRDLDPRCRLAVARDGEEALDYLLGRGAFRHRLGAPLPRLVLLEFRMPRVDGVEVLRALRASPRASAAP